LLFHYSDHGEFLAKNNNIKKKRIFIISSKLVLNTSNMVHSIQIYNIMKEAQRAVTQRFSHQASDARGSLIAEFTLQFRTYETNFR
jgi:hypothetical protein